MHNDKLQLQQILHIISSTNSIINILTTNFEASEHFL